MLSNISLTAVRTVNVFLDGCPYRQGAGMTSTNTFGWWQSHRCIDFSFEEDDAFPEGVENGGVYVGRGGGKAARGGSFN